MECLADFLDSIWYVREAGSYIFQTRPFVSVCPRHMSAISTFKASLYHWTQNYPKYKSHGTPQTTNHQTFTYDSLKNWKLSIKTLLLCTTDGTRQGEHARILPLHRLVGSDLSWLRGPVSGSGEKPACSEERERAKLARRMITIHISASQSLGHTYRLRTIN